MDRRIGVSDSLYMQPLTPDQLVLFLIPVSDLIWEWNGPFVLDCLESVGSSRPYREELRPALLAPGLPRVDLPNRATRGYIVQSDWLRFKSRMSSLHSGARMPYGYER